MTLGEILWLAIKTIATVLWIIFITCLTLFAAIFLGGLRGAAKAKTGSRQVHD